MKLPNWTSKTKLIAGGMAALLCFLLGWWTCRAFTKPIVTTKVVEVPVKVDGGPERPQTTAPNGTVSPGIHYVPSADQPTSPDPLPGFTPTSTTIIEVPVVKPVRVFHQNELKFKMDDTNLTVWIDGRVWAQYLDGSPITGVKAETLYSNDQAKTFTMTQKQKIPPVHYWAVGGKYNVNTQSYGVWVERDSAFLRVGVDVDFVKRDTLTGSMKETQATLRAGIVF